MVRPTNYKRLIVCCDGTWQDGLAEAQPSGYTNVLRIARSLLPFDERVPERPHQIVFYGSGVGSDPSTLLGHAQGLTGAGLATKVEEAYSFISANWVAGDEIFLFGFSRGAYTVRQVAFLLDSIGVLNPIDMESFPALFLALQNEADEDSENLTEEVKKSNKEMLEKFKGKAKVQKDEAEGGWLIKVVGVFETVGALGLPVEITHKKNTNRLLGFNDTKLGPSIQRAYQILGCNETRNDFVPTKWQMTDEGQSKGQTLTQIWAIGSHTDIGGGWPAHDLADITLAWMISNVLDALAVNLDYIKGIPDPVAPWGEQQPHNSVTGIFTLASTSPRQTPTTLPSFPTFEAVHPSVLNNAAIPKSLADSIAAGTAKVVPLQPFEEEIKSLWSFKEGQKQRAMPVTLSKEMEGGIVLPTVAQKQNAASTSNKGAKNGGSQLIEDTIKRNVGDTLRGFGFKTSLGEPAKPKAGGVA